MWIRAVLTLFYQSYDQFYSSYDQVRLSQDQVTSTTKNITWTFDSGASIHVLNDAGCFESLSPTDTMATPAIGPSSGFDGVGSVKVTFLYSNATMILPKVYYKSDFHANLLSVSGLAHMGYYGVWSANSTSIRNKDGELIARMLVAHPFVSRLSFKLLTRIECGHKHNFYNNDTNIHHSVSGPK